MRLEYRKITRRTLQLPNQQCSQTITDFLSAEQDVGKQDGFGTPATSKTGGQGITEQLKG